MEKYTGNPETNYGNKMVDGTRVISNKQIEVNNENLNKFNYLRFSADTGDEKMNEMLRGLTDSYTLGEGIPTKKGLSLDYGVQSLSDSLAGDTLLSNDEKEAMKGIVSKMETELDKYEKNALPLRNIGNQINHSNAIDSATHDSMLKAAGLNLSDPFVASAVAIQKQDIERNQAKIPREQIRKFQEKSKAVKKLNSHPDIARQVSEDLHPTRYNTPKNLSGSLEARLEKVLEKNSGTWSTNDAYSYVDNVLNGKEKLLEEKNKPATPFKETKGFGPRNSNGIVTGNLNKLAEETSSINSQLNAQSFKYSPFNSTPISKEAIKGTGGLSRSPTTWKIKEGSEFKYLNSNGVSETSWTEKLSQSAITRSLLDSLQNFASNMPNYYADSITATYLGAHVRETPAGGLGSKLSQYLFGEMTPNNYKNTPYQAYNRLSKRSFNIDGLSKMSDKQLKLWKKMHREETSKFVRAGGNTDPFDALITETMDVDHNGKKIKENITRQNPYLTKEGLQTTKNQIRDHKKELKSIAEEKKILEAGARLDIIDSNRFFDPDNPRKDPVANLIKREKELKKRIKRHSLGYSGDMINEDLVGPVRPGESTLLGADRHKYSPEHKKMWGSVAYGTSGYGLGFVESLRTSSAEHFARGLMLSGLNPAATGYSLGTSIMENFGVMNSRQKLQAQQARGFAKVFHSAIPLLASGVALHGLSTGESSESIIATALGAGFAQHGWRVGTAFGAGIGGGLAQVGRVVNSPIKTLTGNLPGSSWFSQGGKILGMATGGILGAVTGYALAAGAVEGLADMASNDSSIRSFAKKAASREQFVSTPDTRQSLTARQASLQKLARSGLNDRSQLLGNEAAVLKGIM